MAKTYTYTPSGGLSGILQKRMSNYFSKFMQFMSKLKFIVCGNVHKFPLKRYAAAKSTKYFRAQTIHILRR